MADEFEVVGADQFFDLSKALKAAGRTDLRRELNTGLRRAARPLVAKTRAEARRTLPSRGGLAERVAKAPQRVQVRTGARTAGVRIVVGGTGNNGAKAANRGTVRHPVFGNRDVWVTQEVNPGWFSEPIIENAPAIRRDLEQAVQDVADKIVREARF